MQPVGAAVDRDSSDVGEVVDGVVDGGRGGDVQETNPLDNVNPSNPSIDPRPS
jgi:hypothetical protein